MLAIQTPQALFLAVISLLDQPVESFPVENFGTCALRGGVLGDFGDVHPGFAALCVAFVVTSRESNWRVINYFSDSQTSKTSRHTRLVIGGALDNQLGSTPNRSIELFGKLFPLTQRSFA